MNAVVKKIEIILKSPYDTKNYVDLIREIFPKVSMVSPDKFRKEFTNFSSHIEGSIHVGNYKTPDKKNIIIMAVQLKNAGYVENSRSTQRSYAKKLIENANADAAFIAFYTEGEPKWRLSFVRLDYEMKIENGRLKTTENLTPAKRYSYLVGKMSLAIQQSADLNDLLLTAWQTRNILHWMIWKMRSALKRLQMSFSNCIARNSISYVKNWKKMKIFVSKQNSTISLLHSLPRN